MAERYFTTRKCDMRYEKCCKFLRGGWNERSLSPFLFFFIFFWKLLKSLSFWNRSRVKVNERRRVETAEIGSSRQIYFWRRRRSGMKFQFGTGAIAPRDSANSVTIFLDYQPVRPRHKVAGTRCSTGETTHVRYGLIGRAREFSVTSWRFFFFSIRLFTLPSRYFTFQTRVTRVLYSRASGYFFKIFLFFCIRYCLHI